MKLLKRVSILVKKSGYDTKVTDIENTIPDHDKYTTTSNFDKFLSAIFDERL